MNTDHDRRFDGHPAVRPRRRRGAHRVWKGGGRLRLVLAAAVVTSAVVGAGVSFGAAGSRSGGPDAGVAGGGFDVTDYDITATYQPDTKVVPVAPGCRPGEVPSDGDRAGGLERGFDRPENPAPP